jgi:phosphate transport system protein
MGTRSVLDHDLTVIRDDIMQLGLLVGQAVDRAIDAFIDNDPRLAEEVIKGDDAIDNLHHKLEEHVTTTIALQQPTASDLRKLIADLLITNELERMGDYAEGIGRTISRQDGEKAPEVPPAIREMHKIVAEMIVNVMKAYLAENTEEAMSAAQRDDDVDALYKNLFSSIVTHLGRGDLPSDHGVYVMWAAHNLERIGDRVTNICERILYARTGAVGDFNPKPVEQE